jgi:hypothetical protein
MRTQARSYVVLLNQASLLFCHQSHRVLTLPGDRSLIVCLSGGGPDIPSAIFTTAGIEMKHEHDSRTPSGWPVQTTNA